MEEQSGPRRPRARSDAPSHAPSNAPSNPGSYLSPGPQNAELDRSVSPRGRGSGGADDGSEPPFAPPRRAATTIEVDHQRDFQSPRRRRGDTLATQAPSMLSSAEPGLLRRRSTAISRRSRSAMQGRASGVSERPTAFPTLAGPEPTVQLAQTYENYVSPGYVDLNPAYEQPAYAKPVWSLAKPLPRVVRPGMIPTKDEILEARQNAELPAENSQRLGLDVNPNDLEEGRVRFHPNPAVLSAQLKDSRQQRENNFISNVVAAQNGDGINRRESRASAIGRQSSQLRRPRRSTLLSNAGVPMSPSADGREGDSGASADDLGLSGSNGAGLEPAKSRRSQEEPLETIIEGGETRANSPTNADHDLDDGASVSTIAVDPDEWPALDPLKVVEPPNLFSELHNNHTSFSVIRTHHREFLAEFLGVFMQLTIGFCVDIAHTVLDTTNPNYTAWGWGFATMVGIYVSGGISGAHLNPSITFMLWFFRGFPKRKIPEYWLAQLLGAFVAAFVAYGLYLASINHYLAIHDYSTAASTNIANGFVTSQRYDYIGPATAFFNEFVATAMLAAAVLALGDDQNAPPGAGMNALIIGFLITLEILAFGFQTGAALNPSRDLGPRLALLALGYGKELFTNPYFFYGPIAGTMCGAFVGACLYDVAIFTGGESPINYPWTRTKRSFKKSKAKWRRRITRGERQQIENTHWNDPQVVA